jgi:hypothetical protein
MLYLVAGVGIAYHFLALDAEIVPYFWRPLVAAENKVIALSLPIDVGSIPLTKLNDVFTIWSTLTVSSMVEDRAWMYNGWSRNGRYFDEWVAKTKDFVDHAFSLSLTGTVRFPCRRHEYSIFLNKERVSLDLCQFRFMPVYEVWEYHGEVVPNSNVEK